MSKKKVSPPDPRDAGGSPSGKLIEATAVAIGMIGVAISFVVIAALVILIGRLCG